MIEQRPLVTDEGELIRITVSVGVAQAQAPYEKKELISQADQALYKAKETGRNKVVHYKTANFEHESTESPHVQTLL